IPYPTAPGPILCSYPDSNPAGFTECSRCVVRRPPDHTHANNASCTLKECQNRPPPPPLPLRQRDCVLDCVSRFDIGSPFLRPRRATVPPPQFPAVGFTP